MVKIRALGLVKSVCGWEEKNMEADSLESIMKTLPSEVVRLIKNGDVLVLVNGSESGSLKPENLKLGSEDELVLLPVVHGGKEAYGSVK